MIEYLLGAILNLRGSNFNSGKAKVTALIKLPLKGRRAACAP